jgi:hypothetical protein
MPPRLTIFGTVAVSTTRIHGVHLIEPKIFGGVLDFINGHRLRVRDHQIRVRLARLGALAQPVLEVVHRLDEVRDRQAGNTRVLLPAFAVRIVAEATSADVGPLAVRDDLGHRRVVAGEPVGGAETVGNLLPCERQRAAR